MSACNNCFNGCVETTSDQCVKYTGNTISALGINNGDTLLSVENAITSYILTLITGEGITPTISAEYICTLVDGYLPSEGTITLVDILTALVRSICDLQTQITAIGETIATIEGDYTPGCISVDPSAGTHAFVQELITQVCALNTDVADIFSNLAGYVLISDVNTYIAEYLNSIYSNKQYNKMIAYTAIPFWGDISGKFDGNGVGYNDWENIYICNGYNGITPDMRGFSPVGAVVGASGGTLNPIVTGINYSKGVAYGEKEVLLTVATMPSHAHTAVSGVTDTGHTHTVLAQSKTDIDSGYLAGGGDFIADDGNTTTSSEVTDITVSTSILNNGGGGAHNNIPPIRAFHFIMYCP